MKLMKRLLAISLGAALLCPMTVYADQTTDAMALYNQVEAKCKAMTDMNAYYDFKIKIGGDVKAGPGEAAPAMDMRMEMNVKANHLTDPDNMHLMAYSRITAPDGQQMTSTQYYLNGYSYMDMLGQKIKYAVPMAEMMKQAQSSTGAFEVPADIVKDLSLGSDQDGNQVLSFTMDENKMNDYLKTILGSAEMSSMVGNSAMSMHNISAQYVVNPNGDLIKMRMKMDMDVTADGKTMTMSMDGDVGIADPGQPVDVPVPNPADYTEMSTQA